mgnify:CR=1 FL=1
MMKKRFLCCLCLAIFTAVSLFGFTACSNGSSYDDSALVDRIEALEEQITSLENDNTANKTDIQTLKTKVEALEAANENFQQQLAALDTSSDTFADDLAELTSNYNTLAASVQNATHIERVVVTKDDVENVQLIVSDPVIIIGTTNNYLVVGCRITFSTSLIPYQIVTCNVNIGYNSQNIDVNIYLTRADIGEASSSINGSVITNIQAQSTENITKEFTKIVLYRFY